MIGRYVPRIATFLGMLTIGVGASSQAVARPDPVLAATLSTASTALPTTIGIALLTTGAGPREGARYDAAMVSLISGVVFGPSAGQLYAGGGLSAFLTFALRAVTASVMLTGIHFGLRGTAEQDGLGQALAWVGGIPTGLLIIYDTVNATTQAEQATYAETVHEPQPTTPWEGILGCGPIPCPTRRGLTGDQRPSSRRSASSASKAQGESDMSERSASSASSRISDVPVQTSSASASASAIFEPTFS